MSEPKYPGNTWLNDAELSALDGLPPLHFKLYVAALKRYMDSKSGLIGLKRGISWQSIKEAVYIEPRSGVETVNPSKDQIRRAVAILDSIGLITKIEAGKKLVFKCELATLDRSVQKQAASFSPHQAATDEAKIIPLISETCINENEQAAIPENEQAAIPLISREKKKDIPKGISKKEARRQLPADFQVTAQHLHLAHKNGWPNPHAEFEAFKDYHEAHGSVMLDWDKAFHTWLRRAKRFNARDNQRGVTNHATYRQPSAAVNNSELFWKEWAPEQAASSAEVATLEQAENVYPIFQ